MFIHTLLFGGHIISFTIDTKTTIHMLSIVSEIPTRTMQRPQVIVVLLLQVKYYDIPKFASSLFQRQFDQSVDQILIRYSRSLPKLRVHADLGKAGHRVDLVKDQLTLVIPSAGAFLQEEIDP